MRSQPFNLLEADMKRLAVFSLLILLCATFLLPPFALSGSRGVQVTAKQGQSLYLYNDYHALVVGVGNYTNGWPSLPGALKDSEDVATALQDYGFTVRLVKNPTSRLLKKAVTEMAFVTGKEPNRAFLLYFAGHGETLNLADGTKLGYIIPADCPLKDKDPMGFDDLAVSMKEMEALALKVQCKHVLMMFDSCFSGALFNLVRAAPVEISEKSGTPVRQFITAGEEGEQVPDKSVFKQVFLDGIRSDADLNNDGYVTGSELGMYLQTRVVNYSRGGQHPQYGKINNPRLDKGDFIFVPRATRQQQDEQVRKAEAERAAVSDELKRLQEERKKNEELMEKLKQLLEARVQTEEAQKRRSIEEQKGLEERLKQAEKEKQASSTEAEERIRRMEAQQKALEEEVRRLHAERQKASQAVAETAQKEPGEAREPDIGHEPERLGLPESTQEEVKVAGIPQKPERLGLPELVQAEPELKLAIFPMSIPQYKDQLLQKTLSGIHTVVDTMDIFGEVFSFYDYEGRPDTKRIGKDLPAGEIWKRNNIFSSPEPDADVISREGKKLGVDTVLTLFANVDRNSALFVLYVIDVASKKVYYQKGNVLSGHSHEFRSLVKQVLEDYRKDR
jgi:hypothetical protein